MKKVFYYQTPIGKIGIAEEWGFITNLYFMNMKQSLNAKQIETEILKETYVQLCEYLNKERTEFDIPLNPSGTDFKQTVWSKQKHIKRLHNLSKKSLHKEQSEMRVIKILFPSLFRVTEF